MTEFISLNHCQKEFEVRIKTDRKEHYKAAVDFARKLIDHAKPQTNADHIRAMISTDEGLAEALLQAHYGGMFIPFCKNKPECMDLLEEGRIIPQEECKKCMLAWTREPYKENNA